MTRPELVTIQTEAEPLTGLFYQPEHTGAKGAALLLHGNCQNFYTGPSRFLPEPLLARGIACLAFNRRGHDMVTSLVGRAGAGAHSSWPARGSPTTVPPATGWRRGAI